MIAVTSDILAGVRTFFRWWLAELTSFMPARLRQLSVRLEQIVLMLDRGEVVLSHDHGTRAIVLGRIGDGDHRGRCETVQSILKRRGMGRLLARGKLILCLRLPSNCALRSTIELPAIAESNLAEIVAFELDRHTPFQAEQVYFSYRLLPRDTATQSLRLEVTVVPRAVVDAALKTAAELGLEPDRVEVAGPTPEARPSENLLIEEGWPAARGAGASLTLALSGAAIVLAAIAIAIPVETAHHKAAEMAQEFAAARKRAEAAAAMRQQLAALREEENFLIGRKRQERTLSRLLFETTRILPDDTWLVEFQLVGTDVQLTGLAGSASALIGVLEQSKVFRNTTFRSPVTQDTEAGRERFSIAAHVVQENER